jgi:adenylate cyclase
MSARRSYSFGEYTLDLARGALLQSGADVKLRPKSFEVLRLLIERNGQLVTKDELLDAVWGRTVVTEDSIIQCVIDVRRAIGDESQQMIKTVPRRGYIFDVPVTVSDAASRDYGVTVSGIAAPEREAAGRSSAPSPSQSGPRLLLKGLLAAALISLVPVVIWWGIEGRGKEAVPPVERSAAQAPHNSIAVLPFVNMSSDPESAYFCDGISEEILNRLADFPELHVIARTSSFALKDSGLDARQLSGLLGVRYLLQGSVRKDVGRVRIAAQLVDDSGAQVWSKAYDRELRGIFAIQQEIAEAVAINVVPRIAARSRAQYEAPPNLDAYQHYLAGRAIMATRPPRFWELAEEQFKQAVGIDPQYAEPQTELAILWALSVGWYGDLDKATKQAERAQEAIDRALSLKPDFARVYVAQGVLLFNRHPPDYPLAEAALRKALTLNPNMVDASNWLAGLLVDRGQEAEALAVMERAARIDPLATPLMSNLAMFYLVRGDPARSEQSIRRVLELPQPSYLSYQQLVNLYFDTGRLVEAHEMAKRLVLSYAQSTEPSMWYPLLALSYARLGLWERADYWLTRYERAGHHEFHVPEVTGFNRPELLRLQGRYQEMARALQATLESASGERPARGPASGYGILQALAGDYRGAVQTLGPQVDVGEPSLSDVEAVNARHALAWAYLNSGATDRAHRILRELERRYREREARGWLHMSVDLALFAQNAVLAGDKELAIERLRQAIEAGWRDYYSVSSDPRWRALSNEPRFKELMANVKADVDAQRAQLQRVEDKDDFVARLDSALQK